MRIERPPAVRVRRCPEMAPKATRRLCATSCVVSMRSHEPELPNVLRNVIAHELGHALGLDHNGDATLLMCGRPASCRPGDFQSDTPRFFPLSADERNRLLALYPKDWAPKARD